jgi:cellulose synthase/poly-beta-1,6-N-acetylglucosamine synthase-like glycosyltransferase
MLALSLIIPAKNEENNLVDLCQSLSVQEFKDSFEVIIVDDSDLNHAKYVDSCIDILRGSEVRVKYLRGNGDGVGSAMFRGLSASNGRYVYFLDADNILSKDFMSKVIPWLKEEVKRRRCSLLPFRRSYLEGNNWAFLRYLTTCRFKRRFEIP